MSEEGDFLLFPRGGAMSAVSRDADIRDYWRL